MISRGLTLQKQAYEQFSKVKITVIFKGQYHEDHLTCGIAFGFYTQCLLTWESHGFM